jgi:hypothetical protein
MSDFKKPDEMRGAVQLAIKRFLDRQDLPQNVKISRGPEVLEFSWHIGGPLLAVVRHGAVQKQFDLSEPQAINQMDAFLQTEAEEFVTINYETDRAWRVQVDAVQKIIDGEGTSVQKIHKIREIAVSADIDTNECDFYLDDAEGTWEEFTEAWKESFEGSKEQDPLVRARL